MSEPKNKIKLFEQQPVRAIWDEVAEKYWFSVDLCQGGKWIFFRFWRFAQRIYRTLTLSKTDTAVERFKSIFS